ncbi:MAG: hypothetical protein QM601_07965 [Pseudoxanthomonas sp.]
MKMPSAATTAGIYISDGARTPAKEYQDGTVQVSVADGAPGVDGKAADGVLLTSSKYEATGLVVSNGHYRLGGGKDYYTVYSDIGKDYLGTSTSTGKDKLGSFNSVLLLTLGDKVPKDANTGSSGVDADNQSEVDIDNVYLQVDGAQRYVDSTFAGAKTVINDSYLVGTGNAGKLTSDIKVPFSNEALLISGWSRTNFSVSHSTTYYFNSTVVAEGWAALSTDACGGDGLDLYAYNTTAKALNGGYGTYADFGCRVWLYGSTLASAEIGAIISKSGTIHLLDGAAVDRAVLAYNKGKTTTSPSILTGGRNALMIHAPDMRGEGIGAVDYGHFFARNSTLSTDRRLSSSFDYATYGDAVKKYVDYISGDVILVKSTSADIELDNTKLESYNGVLFHTVLNSDRMGNYLAAGDNQKTKPDGSLIVKPITLGLSNLSASGALLHDDYQRNLEVKLAAASLTGKIVQGTFESWKALWDGKGVATANWLKDKNWSGSNTLTVALDAKSRWTVTDTSTLTGLDIAEGAQLAAAKGQRLVMTVDGVETPIAPGHYQGKIVISPKAG